MSVRTAINSIKMFNKFSSWSPDLKKKQIRRPNTAFRGMQATTSCHAGAINFFMDILVLVAGIHAFKAGQNLWNTTIVEHNQPNIFVNTYNQYSIG